MQTTSPSSNPIRKAGANSLSQVTKRWKWALCFILFLATVLNYMDRQTLGLCKPKIMADFHIDNEQFGELLAAFRWTYALMHIPSGFIADRFSLRLFFALAVSLWSFAGGVVLWVRSVGLFGATRSLLGFSEAVNWPFATRIVANLLPREDRGLGMGIFNSGAALGALAAPLVITPIASAFGWRWSFLIVGALGFAWVALWLWFTRGNRATAFANDAAATAGNRSAKAVLHSFRRILSHPGSWLLVLVSITINPCWYFCCDWIPGFLEGRSGFSFLRAGLLSSLVFLGGGLGNYAGGGLVKYLAHLGWPVGRARGATVVFGACLASCMGAVPHLHDNYAIIATLALAGIGINIIVPNQTACQPEVSFGDTALLAGVTGMAANVFAALVNPKIGAYVDATNGYRLVFYLVAVSPWLSVLAILAFDRLVERRGARQTAL